jgi:hypothetical protein
VTTFVSLQVVWLAMTLIWVIWFADQQAELGLLSKQFGKEYFSNSVALAMLVIGCILLGVFLVLTIILFIFGQKQSALARQQKNFVSSVTHELKSPLASLQLSFETLRRHDLAGDLKDRMLGMILGDIDRLSRLVDQILVTGRLDRGLTLEDGNDKPINLPDFVRNIAKQLAYLDSEVLSRIEINCPSKLSVSIPKGALNLILNNLIENAVKYSPKDKTITVSATQSDKELLIAVKDQGLGLDQKDIRRIFKMFYRDETAVKKAIPGTGLGLYIVRTATRALGGRVWAESDGKNCGSTFCVSLPIAPKTANSP